ncbi:MAG: calcineurin-like phosphoesterase C-terminal domain-containing protein, partial [Planctomyces sp.]
PNGYTIMHFDGQKYLLDYKAARRDQREQIRITAPESAPLAEAANVEFRANAFNAIPGALVQFRLNDGPWHTMTKTENEPDPVFQQLVNEEKQLGDQLPWRKLPAPMACPHLWKASLGTVSTPGNHLIQVKVTNPNGQILEGHRTIRVE